MLWCLFIGTCWLFWICSCLESVQLVPVGLCVSIKENLQCAFKSFSLSNRLHYSLTNQELCVHLTTISAAPRLLHASLFSLFSFPHRPDACWFFFLLLLLFFFPSCSIIKGLAMARVIIVLQCITACVTGRLLQVVGAGSSAR